MLLVYKFVLILGSREILEVVSGVSSTHTSRDFSRLEVIPYNTLKQATNDFNEWKIDKGGSLIAAGSCGQVFLGNWQDQRVAVKRLKKVISYLYIGACHTSCQMIGILH